MEVIILGYYTITDLKKKPKLYAIRNGFILVFIDAEFI